MKNFAIFLLVILIVGTVRGQGEVASQDAAASCHNIFQTKMSSTTALRYSLKLANNEIKELHVSLNETQDMRKAAQDMLNDAKEKEKEVENEIVSKQKYVEELENFIQNLTIEVQELHTTCDGVLAIDCCQIKTALQVVNNGLYDIKDPCSGNNTFNIGKITVRCDMETDGGGWIVLQRRNANFERVNFTRNWEDYVNGFGDLDGEFWIGLNNIYQLTNQQNVELHISVWNDSETSITWNYQTFRISGPENKYRLTVSGGTGDGSDPLAFHNGQYFSTYDRDNDASSGSDCAYVYQGGWWYKNCYRANLNGHHQASGLPGVSQTGQLLALYYANQGFRVYTKSVMMIRSKTCGLD